MCRFLIIKTKDGNKNLENILKFKNICQKSQKWQGDGWGVSWLEGGFWKTHKSVKPIWEDNLEKMVPESNFLMLHARGASFPKHKNNIDYNQPFIKKELAFVFNGFLNNVSLPFKIDEEIGSKKIFKLINKTSKESLSLFETLKKARDLLKENTKLIEALNICLCTQENINTLCLYNTSGRYHQVVKRITDKELLISSEPLDDSSEWKDLKNGQVENIKLNEI